MASSDRRLTTSASSISGASVGSGVGVAVAVAVGAALNEKLTIETKSIAE